MIKLDNENKLVPAYMTELYKNDGNNYIDRLPDELMLKIFEYLGVNDLGQVAQVCREWCNLSEDDALWNELLKQDFQKKKSVDQAKRVYKRRYLFTTNLSKGIYVTREYYATAMLVNKQKRVIACNNKEIKIFDLTTGNEEQTLIGHKNIIYRLIETKDKKLISISSENNNNTIKIWDLNSGKCEKTFLHQDSVSSCLVTEQGKLVLGSSSGNIFIQDLNNDQCEQLIHFLGDTVSFLIETPEKELISSGSSLIKIWKQNKESCNYDCKWELAEHAYNISCLFYSPTRKIISGSCDHRIKIWNPETGECEHTLIGHPASISSLSWVAEEKQLVSSCTKGYIRFWDLNVGLCVREFMADDKGIYYPLLITNRKIISWVNGMAIKIWDLKSGKCEQVLNVSRCCFDDLLIKKGQLISFDKIWDFTASTREIWEEIALNFVFLSKGNKDLKSKAQAYSDRFNRMSAKEKNAIYEALYPIIKSSLKEGQDTSGCAEKAFHDQDGYSSSLLQKAQAICCYLLSKERSEVGKIAVLFATGFIAEGVEQFVKLSVEEKNGIYEELYKIIKFSLTVEEDTIGCAEKAFFCAGGYSTPKEKAQAIRNYINKKIN